MNDSLRHPEWFAALLLAVATLLLPRTAVARENGSSPQNLELSRPVRPWEFLPVVGTRAALFGNETGRMEAWVYPLKILRGLHLTFHVGGVVVPAEDLARTLVVRPESSTIVYVGDNFSVRETFFVPVHEPGAVILLEVETEQPLGIEAGFISDFQLEWPAALGGTFVSWNDAPRAFVFGEESKRFAALVGSPMASNLHSAYETNYSSSDENAMTLGVVTKGKGTKIIVLAASTQGLSDAQKTYENLEKSYDDLIRESAQYYRDYLSRTVSLSLPDAQLQQAYDWSRISVLQGVVTNPYLGTGLVAGYRTSGRGQRPGFAWFFGRDSFWTSFALNSIGDFATTRSALDFIAKFQRDDGKIPHEISQSASFVPWFTGYPYAYASADASPLYIIAADDYVAKSGDIEFARQKWGSLWKAYQFVVNSYDAQGFAQNLGFGHGWVEGGPLLPVKTEFYQAGLGLQALRALADLAQLSGKERVSQDLRAEFERRKPTFNQLFWSPEKDGYAFALDQQDHRVDEISVLATVPMWFGLTDEDKSEATIRRLADADFQTDWGMRIISNQSPIYNSSGYHFGSVWPLFTGWASVGEYRYHQSISAYSNLRANALLALDGSLGHVTEVLSGDYYQPLATSSPDQIWSAAMVISPILRGMLGLQLNVPAATLTFAPHLPISWDSVTVRNLACGGPVDLTYHRAADAISLDISRERNESCTLEFSPEISPRTRVISANFDGHKVPFHVSASSTDQHVGVSVKPPQGHSTLHIRLQDDFGLSMTNELPPLGSTSRRLRILSESWNLSHTQLTVAVSGLAGSRYRLFVENPCQIATVRGGALNYTRPDAGELVVDLPPDKLGFYVHQELVLSFRETCLAR